MQDNSETMLGYINYGRDVHILYVAAIVAMVYDTVCSLAEEIEYVWCGMRWSIPKLLYIISRYYSILYVLVQSILPSNLASGLISVATCRAAIWFHQCAGVVIIGTAVDLIFLLRVNAIYHNSGRVVFLLTVGFIGRELTMSFVYLLFSILVQFVAALTMAIYISVSMSSVITAISGSRCSTTNENLSVKLTSMNIYKGVSLVFHVVLFASTIARAGGDVISHENGGLRNLFRYEAYHNGPIVVTVVRDGSLYFCILFVTVIMMVMASTTGYTPYNVFPYIASILQILILSFTGCRMILHLRKLSDPSDANETAPYVTQSIFFARIDRGTDNSQDSGYN
ncbi:hypothetical protein BDQ17DRAFT_1357247 [Cyathus striatus]|nr:hypothetical protein BDQ17DRAFT_1357247 [Cyathus striatus]